MRLRKIRAYCVPENAASRTVLDRVGFEEDGVLPRAEPLYAERRLMYWATCSNANELKYRRSETRCSA